MSAPLPLAVYGLLQERFQLLVNPFATLDLRFGDDDHMG